MTELFTIGLTSPLQNRWQRLIDALCLARVDLLVDIRHSPCASDPNPRTRSRYGAQRWHLQVEPDGLSSGVQAAGIDYVWLVELGNPQRRDPQMRVLKHHLSHRDGWPVHRGLSILCDWVVKQNKRCCLLCACTEYASCHRRLVAEAFREKVGKNGVTIRDLT